MAYAMIDGDLPLARWTAVRPSKTKSELELAIRADLRDEPLCAKLPFSVRYNDDGRANWTVVPPPGHGWAPYCWRRLEKVVTSLQASYDLAPDAISTDELIPIIMRETSIELGAERGRFEVAPPFKVDVFPGGRWTASPEAGVPREYWTAFRRAVRRLQHEVEIVTERRADRAV
jgi:hypothetical protein